MHIVIIVVYDKLCVCVDKLCVCLSFISLILSLTVSTLLFNGADRKA